MIELRVVVRARADAVIGEFRLMGIDEGHAVGVGVGALATRFAARQRLHPRQKLRQHEVGHVLQARFVGGERRMDVEPVAAAGAGRAALHGRVAVGHVNDAGQVAADQRLQRVAELGEIIGKFAVEHGLRLRHGGELAALVEQRALDAGADDDVGDEAGEFDVVGADGEQHEIEPAARHVACGPCRASPATARSAAAPCRRSARSAGSRWRLASRTGRSRSSHRCTRAAGR